MIRCLLLVSRKTLMGTGHHEQRKVHLDFPKLNILYDLESKDGIGYTECTCDVSIFAASYYFSRFCYEILRKTFTRWNITRVAFVNDFCFSKKNKGIQVC